jgi:hypothetical protein
LSPWRKRARLPRYRDCGISKARSDDDNIDIGNSLGKVFIACQFNLKVKHLQIAPTKRLYSFSAERLSFGRLIYYEQFHDTFLLKMKFR